MHCRQVQGSIWTSGKSLPDWTLWHIPNRLPLPSGNNIADVRTPVWCSLSPERCPGYVYEGWLCPIWHRVLRHTLCCRHVLHVLLPGNKLRESPVNRGGLRYVHRVCRYPCRKHWWQPLHGFLLSASDADVYPWWHHPDRHGRSRR